MAPPMRAKPAPTPTAPPPAARKPDPWGGGAPAAGSPAAGVHARAKAGAAPTTNMKMWYAGAAILAFGIVDLVLYIAIGWDLTGVAWSPYLASIVGGGLIKASTK